MATKTANRPPRSHDRKKTVPNTEEANAQRSQQERRLLNWINGNAQMVLTSLAREATYLGDNGRNFEMNQCLARAAEFGKIAGVGDASGIPAHFTQQQQRAETQSETAIAANASG